MTIGDYEQVYALWMGSSGMGLNNLDDSREGIARFLRRNPATCLVAEEGERVVGVILAGNDGRADISIIPPSRRIAGIGESAAHLYRPFWTRWPRRASTRRRSSCSAAIGPATRFGRRRALRSGRI